MTDPPLIVDAHVLADLQRLLHDARQPIGVVDGLLGTIEDTAGERHFLREKIGRATTLSRHALELIDARLPRRSAATAAPVIGPPIPDSATSDLAVVAHRVAANLARLYPARIACRAPVPVQVRVPESLLCPAVHAIAYTALSGPGRGPALIRVRAAGRSAEWSLTEVAPYANRAGREDVDSLVSAAGLVAAHGGTVTFGAAPGGWRVRLRLPLDVAA